MMIPLSVEPCVGPPGRPQRCVGGVNRSRARPTSVPDQSVYLLNAAAAQVFRAGHDHRFGAAAGLSGPIPHRNGDLDQSGTVMAIPAPARPKYLFKKVVIQPSRPYFVVNRSSIPRASSSVRSRATPSMERPRGRPRIVQGASSTRPLLRIRLIFPAAGFDHTCSSSPCRTAQTGVGTGTPFFPKVV